MNGTVIVKMGEYESLPMTETLFWNRVGWLQRAMLTSEDFEFRVIWFHKLQDMMRSVP
jgi:hypothetical protein|tara:strand:+ start:203 stop:376 length:174 start_codon:yes stop_codon:yes gene_type:complete